MRDKSTREDPVEDNFHGIKDGMSIRSTMDIQKEKAEKELRESEERYRTFFENCKDALCITTPEGKLVDGNPAMLSLLGYTREEIMAKNAREIYFHSLDRYGFQQEIEQRGFVKDHRAVLQRKDGTQINCLLTATVRRTGGGKTLEYQGIIVNITDETLIQRLQKANEKLSSEVIALRAANRELETIICSACQNLRFYTGTIDRIAGTRIEPPSNRLAGGKVDYLNMIKLKTEEMLKLIDKLLTLSSLDGRELNPCTIDMESLARTVFQELTNLSPEQTFRLDVASYLPPARGDKELVREILINLLADVIRSANTGAGVIEVGGKEGEGGNNYYVKGTCMAIDARYATNLLNGFHTVPSRTNSEEIGVGLAIAQRLVRWHGGHVWVEGGLNEGATFHFTLPR